MSELGRVCVFSGSSPGRDPEYRAAAGALGRLLAARASRVVYGGASVGLMGAMADAALAAGAEVVGIIPRGLFTREVAHLGLSELVEVDTMHERKQRMYDLADGFVALPGGLGTLEELAEVATWVQLGLHAKPLVLLDVRGFWQPLVALLDGAVAAGFLTPANRSIIRVAPSVDDVPAALAAPPPRARREVDRPRVDLTRGRLVANSRPVLGS